MNPGDVTTTEINTEIMFEVKVETEAIVKVETINSPQCKLPNSNNSSMPISDATSSEVIKSREEIKAEREAKKLAKQAKKQKPSGPVVENVITNAVEANDEKSREQIKAEREAKKLAKQSVKSAKAEGGKAIGAATEQVAQLKINNNSRPQEVAVKSSDASAADKKPALTKAERRAIQEAQRAAKAQALAKKTQPTTKSFVVPSKPQAKATASNQTTSSGADLPGKSPTKRVSSKSPVKSVRFNDGNVKLFSHLERAKTNVNLFVNSAQIPPSIARLGEQYAKRTVVGSNARCVAFLNAVKMVIQDFETPPKKEFARSLESYLSNGVEYLQKCRSLAVSVINAHKNLKQVLMQLPNNLPESELKEKLFNFIDTYIENQIGKAAQAINSVMQKKINNGDVILTFGCSSLIHYICEEAQLRKIDFRVIVVDSRPFCEGQELLRRLTAKEIPCTYVLINAVSFVMPEVTKVLLGAHALLANGYVMARTGTAQVALVARSFNVPVLVCCETHKFSERFQTDAIVYNELGNPDDIVVDNKCCLTNWQAKHKMSPLNLNYDITPPELVTAVVTEVSVLPCTSVPVILRMKPDWLVYAT